MKKNKLGSLSDEIINSLVDNEIPTAERAELLAHLQIDKQSKDKVCEINYLKDRVKTAYSDIPPSMHKADKRNSIIGKQSIAAGIFFVFLIAGLVFSSLNSNHQTPDSQRLVMIDPDGRGQQLSQNSINELRVIFHVSTSTRFNADELLDDIESLLKQSIQENKRIRIEVVAHAAGLDLLRERLSTEKKRISNMSRQYPELTFVACLNTVERLKREKGIDVKLISDAVTTLSGVAHVVKRQQQGWVYIQV